MPTNSMSRLTAGDMMRTDIVSVNPDDSLQVALSSMIENHVTGLPVLNRKSRCVGVVSATDILNFEQDHADDASGANADLARYFDPETNRWEDLRVTSLALEEFAEIPVSEIMNRDVIAVSPAATIQKVAQRMVSQEIHRVLVLDDEQYLLGLISAIDFVRLFADSGD